MASLETPEALSDILGRICEAVGWTRLALLLCTDEVNGVSGPGDVAVVVHPDVPVDSLTTADLRRLTGIHPTVAELLPSLAGELGPVLEAATAAS